MENAILKAFRSGGIRMRIWMLLYLIAAYWAAGKTIFAGKVRVGSMSGLFIQQMTVGFLLGIILIPIAVVKVLIQK